MNQNKFKGANNKDRYSEVSLVTLSFDEIFKRILDEATTASISVIFTNKWSALKKAIGSADRKPPTLGRET